jgi:hypothetical protein
MDLVTEQPVVKKPIARSASSSTAVPKKIVEVVIPTRIGPPKKGGKVRGPQPKKTVNDTSPPKAVEVPEVTFSEMSATSELPIDSSTSVVSSLMSFPLSSFESIIPGISDPITLTNSHYIELPTLTESEKDMTVEEWVRSEIEQQYLRLKRDGEESIRQFKERSKVIRRNIEVL